MRIRPAEFVAMPWKNGQGVTHEIAREPASGVQFLWRLSLAEVAASGDFSLFPGYDRTIALVSGEGMELAFEEAPTKRLDRPMQPFAFKGEWHCRSRLLGGPCRDLNLMVDRAHATSDAECLALDGGLVPRHVAKGWLLAYCAAGEVSIGSEKAKAGEVLKLAAGRHDVIVKGQALLFAIHLTPGTLRA